MPPETLNLPLITREASLRLVRSEGDDMTIDVIWTTGATVQRRRYEGWDDVVEYDEELVVTPGAVRMDRLNAGAPFLDSHRSWGLESVVGAVLPGSARIEGGQGFARVRLTSAPDAAPIVQRVMDGTVSAVYGPRTAAALKAVAAEGGAIRNPKPPTVAPTGPMIFQGSARYPVDEIVIHCAATQPDWMRGQPLTAKRKEIDRWHREERGWRKIGYHHLVDRDGAILPGRAETEVGAGVEGHNRGVIHICLIGGVGSTATDPFERNFTAAQDRALRGLIDAIRAETAITRITGHNDHAAKACPGFVVRNWINRA